jgi:sulfhydrogenase subunit beta (sulfur reductase)
MTALQLKEIFNYLKKSRVIFGPAEIKTDEVGRPAILIKELDDFDDLTLDSRLPFYSFKKFFVPEQEKLFRYSGAGLEIPSVLSFKKGEKLEEKSGRAECIALFGMNLLDLKSVLLYDQVFEKDPYYQQRRRNILVIGHSLAPNVSQNIFEETFEEDVLEHLCFDIFLGASNNAVRPPFNLKEGKPAGNASCAQGKGRPKKKMNGEGEINYAVFTGSLLGQKILDDFGYRDYAHIQFSGPVKEGRLDERMLRLKDKLENCHNQKIWDELGKRCIECGKCTVACPTCFCFRIDDQPSFESGKGERQRCWDSCFFQEFSEVAGPSTGASAMSSAPNSPGRGHKFLSTAAQRIHFWYFHKFARISNEFNFMGCVGCRRCAAVCPVGIDIAEVLKDIEAS